MDRIPNVVEKNKNEEWEDLARAVNRFSQEDPIPMDEGIKDSVVALMAHRFRTVASCFGHLEDEEGTPYPWVAIRGSADIDARFDDERIEANNTKYFEDKSLLSEDERIEIEELQNAMKSSAESERQRLLAELEEFYSNRNPEPGIRLTVSSLPRWLVSEEVAGSNSDEIRKSTSTDDLEVKLEKYRAEMVAFTEFLKNKFFA